MVKPGGTSSPHLAISHRLAPLPPSCKEGEGRGGEEGEVSCKQKGEVVDSSVGFKSGEGIIVGQTQKGVEAKSEAPERRLGFTDGGAQDGRLLTSAFISFAPSLFPFRNV